MARHYQSRGYRVLAKRWRGGRAEIDLVLEINGGLVFCEVKKSKSNARAVIAFGAAQQQRYQNAALAFLAEHDYPLETDLRFDLATVDFMGQIEIAENVIS